MLKQIVFIYRDSFVCSLVEKNLKKEDIKCYASADLDENIAYIIDDLGPDFVVVDEKVLDAGQVSASLNDAKASFKTVLLTAQEKEVKGFDHIIKLPFDPMALSKALRGFLA